MRKIIRKQKDGTTAASSPSGASSALAAGEELNPASAAPVEELKDFRIWNHAAASFLDGSILVVGGQSGNKLSKSFFLYDPLKDSWKENKLPFQPRVNPGLSNFGGKRALLVGGSTRAVTYEYDDSGRSKGINDAWMFEDGGWWQVAAPAYSHASPNLVECDGNILILDESSEIWIGEDRDFISLPQIIVGSKDAVAVTRKGVVGHTKRGTFVWDPRTKEATPLPEVFSPRHGTVLVDTPKGLMMLGGFITGKGPTDRIDIFDGRHWKEFGRLAVPRANHKVLKYKDRLIVIGGESENREPLAIELVNPMAGKIDASKDQVLPSMANHQAVISKDRICVIGGWSQAQEAAEDGTLGVRWISANELL